MAAILTDPENENRSAEEVADRVLDKMFALAVSKAKAELRDETRREIFDKDHQARRLAVVGQIRFTAQEDPQTVILGPFHAQGALTDPGKFRTVVAKACASAREAGGGLAWDPKTRVGRGRFMLAPAFMHPRDAWEFFRPDEPDPRLLRIQETLSRWEAGKWATEVAYGPANDYERRER